MHNLHPTTTPPQASNSLTLTPQKKTRGGGTAASAAAAAVGMRTPVKGGQGGQGGYYSSPHGKGAITSSSSPIVRVYWIRVVKLVCC